VAATAAPLAVAPHQLLSCHRQWRRTNFCHTTVDGAAKKGYSGEIVSPMVYFLRLYQV
jgi:hypothetical protein